MLDVPAPPASGNHLVVEMLEKWLDKARKGNINHATITACEVPNRIGIDFAGSIEMQYEVLTALDRLKTRVSDACMDREPPFDPSLDASHVCFSLACGVISYDFVPWLIAAEMSRVREGAPDPLKVSFFINSGTMLTPYHEEMLANVIVPLVGMIGGAGEKNSGNGNFCITYKDIVQYAKDGEIVPKFKPNRTASSSVASYLDGQTPVTITLREAEHHPHRNSNLAEWIMFARWLKCRGEDVIFLRDTGKANEPIDGFQTCPQASEDLNFRCALYESAKCNLFVGNGPSTLAMHGSKPFLLFFETDPEHRRVWKPAWPEWWPVNHGINVGEQFPWCAENQRIVWKRDTFENIKEAWASSTI